MQQPGRPDVPAAAGSAVVGGRYRVERVLGEGPFARTFQGRDLTTGARVLIKTTPVDRIPAAAAVRLEHEAAVLARLDAPELATLLALGREDGRAYLITPFVPGAPLDVRLRDGPLTLDEALAVACCLARALVHIHAHGVVHGDVKPANVIVDGDTVVERAVLIDFGLARSAALDAAVSDHPAGTARYVSPEQAGMLDAGADERSDLYSAGILLFECLAGHPPFRAETVGALLRQHLSTPLPSLRGQGVRIPAALEELVARLVRKDPGDRYQSARAVLADLEGIAEAVGRGVAEPAVVIGQHDRRRTLTEPAFVGRAQNLAALETAIAAASHGQGELVFLEGVSGGGKTHLLGEVARRAAMRGLWVLHGQGRDQAANAPLQMLTGVVDGVVAAAASDPTRLSAITAALGAHVDAVCHALPALAGVLGAQRDVALGPEDFGEGRTLEALTALVHALGTAQRPALLTLDDCQWADDLTMKLLAHWSSDRDGPRHVVVVVAFRSEDVPDAHALRRLDPGAHVRLAAFAPADVGLMVESMAGPVPPAAVAMVHQLSEGNPFMASAVLRGLVESGVLVDAADGWRLEGQAIGEIQSSREAARFLARRLELLPDDTLTLLTVGAVLGKDFDVDLAADLAGQRPQDAMGCLHEARRRHIVWAEVERNRCSFVHDKLREALLERLDEAARRQLHRLVALRLEQLDPEGVFDLAYHFDAAGEHARSLPYALAAGAQARAQHGLQVAEDQYRIALRGAPWADATVRRRTVQELGEVLMLRGRYDEAATCLAEADALATDDRARAQIAAQLGELAFKRGDVEAGVEALERALHLLGQRVPAGKAGAVAWLLWEVLVQALHTAVPRIFLARRPAGSDTDVLAIRSYSRLTYAYWFARGKVACVWAHLREMNLAERAAPGPELAQAYSEHAPVMTVVPLFGRGVAYAQRSLALRRAAGDAWGEGQSLHFYGAVLYAASRYRESMQRCRGAAQLLERTGDRWEVNTANWHVAYCLYRLGDLREAIAAAQAVHRAGVEIGDAQACGISLSVWAKASGGRVPQELIDVELARGSDDVHTAAEVAQAQALRLLCDARPGEAVAVLTRAQQRIRATGLRQEYVAPVSTWLATALVQEAATAQDLTPRRRARLVRDAARAARRARRSARWYRNNLPHALRDSALVAALQGRPSLARRRFEGSLRVAAAQSARWEHAQTLLARAQVAGELGWSGATEDRAAATAAMREVAGAEPPHDGAGLELAPPVEDHTGREATLSLADRFDTVLEAGRGIASALTRAGVFTAVHDAVRILLRGERCVVLEVRDRAGEDVGAVSTELHCELDDLCRHLVRQVVASARAASLGGAGDGTAAGELMAACGTRSALCAPVLVRDRVVGAFYVSHSQVSGLFGSEEQRLAEFIATLAGAALENAEGFAEVQALTRTLEERVAERTAQLAAVNSKLTHQAFHDPLTQLANRVLFRERIDHAITLRQRAAQPLAVLLIDLDDFKNVNDTWGHAAGDELLVGVADRLRQSLRPADTIARLGGDEFGVLVEEPMESAEAMALAERIVGDLTPPFRFQDAVVWTHASIGIAVGNGEHDSADELLRKADAAMYVAKDRGKNHVAVFEPHMLAAVVTRGRMHADLQRAVEQHQKQEFAVHYQPIMELASGRVSAVEALVRWNRSGRETTLPNDFVPLAEEAGFIVQIGAWILERACRQVAAWQRAQPGDQALDLHVNLSARQLHNAGFVDSVAAVLSATGLAPGSLVLEITESGLMKDPAAAALQLCALREFGVRLALDDFGTGYSSLGYLHRFPIDVLKIDKGFMEPMGNGRPSSSLPRVIVQLGQTLGLAVVAEGVEQAVQAAELRALGCQLGQGYLWSRPRPAGEMERWMRDRPPSRSLAEGA